MATITDSNNSSKKQNLFDRLPPQNLEAEQSVLGSMLLMNEAIDEVADFLVADHFYNDANQKIYAAIMGLNERGVRGIDPVTLADELERVDQFADVGGALYIADILESVPHAAHVRYYADIVRDKWLQRKLIYSCTEVLRESYDANRPIDDILTSAEKSIFGILELRTDNEKFALKDILLDAFNRIEERRESDGVVSGIATGFVDFDTKLSGFQPAELIILAARPSMGKTALVCNWAEGIVRHNENQAVLVFSLEQSQIELAERLLCIQAQVDGHKVKSGEIDDAERHRLMVAASDLEKAPMFIDDKPGRTISQISAISRRLKRMQVNAGGDLGAIIIDYLQLIEPEDKRQPREQQIAYISRRLKFLAKELSVPVIALAQLNRGVELREDKRPRLADLRESGAIEQDADVITFLHRPEQYDPEDRPGEAELIIAKNRSGPTGIVTLTWRAEFMRFEDYASSAHLSDGADF